MSDSKKVQCSKCERMIDPRGLQAHVRTHEANHQAKPKNIKRITPNRKREPVSVDLESFRLGLHLGKEIFGKAVA